MCNVNVVNRIRCFCLIFFLRGDWGGFGHPGHPLATPLTKSLITVFCASSFHVNSIYHITPAQTWSLLNRISLRLYLQRVTDFRTLCSKTRKTTAQKVKEKRNYVNIWKICKQMLWHIRCATVFVRATNQWEKSNIPATSKLLNRLASKFVSLITSWISILVQNFVKIYLYWGFSRMPARKTRPRSRKDSGHILMRVSTCLLGLRN